MEKTIGLFGQPNSMNRNEDHFQEVMESFLMLCNPGYMLLCKEQMN